MKELTAKLKSKVLVGLICALFLLAGVLLLPPLIRTAQAAASGDYEYTVNEDGITATITGYTGAGGDIIIPDTVMDGTNTFTVTAVGESAFAGKTAVTSAMIPNGVTSVGTSAFSGCSELRAAYFLGNAPAADESIFSSCAADLTLYYKSASTGFSDPWNGYATAVFNPDVNYTIAFNLNGATGTVPDSQTVYKGVKVLCPADPIWEGKAFGGWYTEETCDYAWSLNTPVTADIMLFAKWTIDKLTVAFDSQGGSAVANIEADYNTTISEPTEPVWKGYSFGGWYTDAQCTGVWNFASDHVTSDVTLYAKWTILIYSDSGVIEKEDFTPLDMVASLDGTAVYMTGTNNCFVYRYDVETGDVTALPTPYPARELSFSIDGVLLATMSNPASKIDTVALIDPNTFTSIALINVLLRYDEYLTGVKADSNYIYAYNGGGIYLYSRSDYEYLSYCNGSFDDVEINPASGQIYATQSGRTMSLKVSDGKLVNVKYNDHDYSDGPITIMPDGKHLLLSDGTILTCGQTASEDLVYVTKLKKANVVSINPEANELYISCNRIINVYDASDLKFIRIMAEPAIADFLICGNGTLTVAEGNTDGDIIMHSVYADALLQNLLIDGEPFTEFFPTYLNIDRGEVPYSTESVNITAVAVRAGAVVSGDTGTQSLSVGENTFHITVTNSLTGHSATYTIMLTRLESNPEVTSHNAMTNLGFIPNDVVLDPNGTVAYMTAAGGYSLYRVDLVTGEIQEKKFDIYAEKLAVANGKIYLTLKRDNIHAYLNDGFWYGGAIAVVDASTFTIENIFEVYLYAWDIEADDSGRMYMSCSNGMNTLLSSYHDNNGQFISEHYSTSGCDNIDIDLSVSKIYAVSTDTSPMEIEAYDIANGEISSVHGSPYHGDYDLKSYMQISPDGRRLFNGSGDIFTCASTNTGDMVYDGRIASIYTSLCFNPNNSMVYTSNRKTLNVFDYQTRMLLYTHTSSDTFINIFYSDNEIIALQKNSSEHYFIRYINTEQNVNLSKLGVSVGTLTSSFDAATTSYTLVLDAQSEQVTISPELSDNSASMTIGGIATTSKTVSLEPGCWGSVSIVVRSGDGFFNRTYTLKIYRQSEDDTFVIDESYLKPSAKVVDPDRPFVYMLGSNDPFLYRIGEDGALSVLRLPGTADGLGFAGGVIAVSIKNTSFDYYAVALINPETFSLIETFEVEVDYTGFTGDEYNIIAYNADGIYVYSKTNFILTSSILEYKLYNVILDRVTGKLYATSYWNVGSYVVNNGIITLTKKIANQYVSGLSIMPDSEHLVLSNGDIYSCSPVNTQDLVLTSTINKDDRILCTASSTNELFIANNCVVYVFDASDFSYKRFITETAAVEYMMYSDGVLFLAQKNEDGHMFLRTVYPSALLKSLAVDTEPSSEFYSTQTNVYWGEVPYASASVNITAIAAQYNAVVSGDIGIQALSTGANELTITVTDPLSGLSEAYTVHITRRSSDPVSTFNAFTNLGFTPLDMELDPDRAVAYMTAKDGHNLYRIDLETGTIQKKTFAMKVERVAIANGKIYITLPRHEHTGYNYTAEYGAVAVVDAATLKTENIFDVCIDPYDIETDSLGNVYIAPGSGQHSMISQYDSSNGRHIKDVQTIYMQGYIDSNPQMNRLYYFDTLITPRGMTAIEVINGVYTSRYNWQYGWENYDITKYSCISSDGMYIFNGSGNVFTCSTTKADDMDYDENIGTTFTSISFDIPNNRFYTVNEKTLTVFEYENRTEVDTLVSSDTFISIQHDGENIVALQKDGSGRYYINQNLLTTNSADLVSIASSKGSLSPSFDRDIVEYDIIIPNTEASTVITPTTEDRDATVLIDGIKVDSKTVTLGVGETCDVVIAVASEDGTTQKTYMLHVSKEPYSNNASLSGITLSSGTLSPGFATDAVEYSILLPNTVSSIRVTPVKDFSLATMTIDGVIVSSKSISLTVGVTMDMVIQVTAQDGVTRKIYTLHMTRVASTNANLSGITLSTGSLSPSFEASTAEYSVILPSIQSSVKITPVRSDSTASIKIGGVSTSSTTLPLNGGESKNVVILVTAQDNLTIKEYTLHVSREAVAVTGITINHTSKVMLPDAFANLSATVSPQDATYPTVTWSSSNTAVASVDQSGKVTAMSTGRATITATADGISATCEVTVQPTTYSITTAANNTGYGSVTGGGVYGNGKSVTLTATPKAGYRFVRWLDGAAQLSSSATYALTANADRSITAEFAPIGTPTVTAASAGYTGAQITWTAVEGAAGYEVWRSTSPYGSYAKLATTSGTSYADNGLVTNATYYYKVNAYCSVSTATTYGSQSAYSAATPVPSAPQLYVSATSYNRTNVSWSAVAGVSGYELSRATSQNGTYKVVKTTTATSYTNTSLATGTTYYYRVRAYRTIGRTKVWGDYSPIISGTPNLSSVTSTTAAAYYPTSVKVSWNSVAGRTKYEVWRSTSPSSGFALIKTTSSTYFKDTTLRPFVTYYYQIRVYRTVSRQKVYSASVSPTASATPIMNNVTGVKAAMSSPGSNKISWASVTGASGYEVWRSTSANSGYVLVKSTSSKRYTDSNLPPNTTYYYQVRAYRKVGGSPVPSAFSAPVSATPYFGSVTSPRAVRSSAVKIKLTWKAVSGRSGYEVYRSTSPDSGFVLVKSTTSTSFTDSGLTTGVTYFYKICAYRTVSGAKYRSAESVVVSATP